MFTYASKCKRYEKRSFNITVTHRSSGDVSTFYRVPFFKALHVMAYLRSVHNAVSYEVSQC